MEEEKIIGFITGQLEQEEKEEVLNRIANSPENKEEYYKLKNLWALTTHFNAPLEVNKNDIAFFQKNLRRKQYQIIKKQTLSILKYAAIALIAMIVGKYLFQNKKITIQVDPITFNEITVPPGQMAKVCLSDCTTVYINSSSKLKYPAKFNSKERRVFLSGEAFFEVKKNRAPFLVETNTRVVKVLGTKFNVMAYPNDRYYQTTLVEGSIALSDIKGKPIADLIPGEQYSFDTLKKASVLKTIRPDIYDSWKEGIYIFDHETLGGIAERLERIFAVKIHIQNNYIRSYKFTGTISRNIPFEQILKIIQISAPVKYTLKEVHGGIEEVNLY